MAYEVTATRRRPQRFEDVADQEFVVATLKNSIETGKIAHAYLFSGPRGCGKTSSARILAKALNCQNGPSAEPCGKCTACEEITRGASLDVIEIDGASNTSVNDVRQIKDEVLFPPNSLRYKIYIIDEVHMLSTSAFNALLKTIEEPPPYVIFIFATTELHKVPATIKSRCQQFNFRLAAPDTVKKLLAYAAAEMNIQADDEALYWIARESTGSFRDAYTLFDQIVTFSGDHITFDKIRDKLGITGVDRLNELCNFCIDGDSALALEKLDEILQTGVSIEQFIVNFTDYIRSLLLIQCNVTKESLLGQSVNRYSEKVRNAWDSIRLERALSLFLQLFRDIRYSLSPRFELELAISRLTWLSSYISPAEVASAAGQIRNLLCSSPSAPLQQINPTLPVKQGITAQGDTRPLSDSGFGIKQPETANPFEQMKRKLEHPSPVTVQSPHDEALTLMRESYSAEDYSESQPEASIAHDTAPVLSITSSLSEIKSQPEALSQSEQVFNQEIPQNDITSHYEHILQKEGISGDALIHEAIQIISDEKAFIATALSQITDWSFSNETVTAKSEKVFQKNQLESEAGYISQILSKLHERPLRFTVELIEHKETNSENSAVPPEVFILCRVFKGTQIKN